MNLVTRVNAECVKARNEGKSEFKIQCRDWEIVARYLEAEAVINDALADQEEAIAEMKEW